MQEQRKAVLAPQDRNGGRGPIAGLCNAKPAFEDLP
jgi:hypothetical protein